MRSHPVYSARRSLPLKTGVLVAVVGCFTFVAVAIGSENRRTAVVQAIEKNEAATVNIHGQKTVTGPDEVTGRNDGPRKVNGMGTGVILDERGYIVTNYHVVEGVRNIQVTLKDKRTFTAQLLTHDAKLDLAIIKVNSSDKLPTMTIGTSKDLLLGETVIAIGNAYGYEHTATRGIVSALHRTVQVSDIQDYEDLIQTDAPINPGNSGGPLLNIDGEMIGINVAVRAGAQGIAFAIPVDKVLAATSNLMSTQKIDNTWHGAITQDAASKNGAMIKSIEDASPAAAGGLKAGDLVTSVGGRTIQRPLDFERALYGHKVGEEVPVIVERDSKTVTMNLALNSAGKRGTAVASGTENDPVWDTLGLKLTPVPASQFTQTSSRYRGGLSVVNVRADSPAAKQGIRRGDILVGMHVWETVTLDNVQYILNRPDFADLEPVKFYIIRGSETLFGHMSLAMQKR